MYELRDYQSRAIDATRKAYQNGYNAPCLVLPTGAGKCLGKNTPILMYDGSIKKVQDVIVGDKLMGPDGTPRNVLSTTKGKEKLYKITPTKGNPYVVNASHILSLRRSGTKDTITLADGTVVKKDEEIVNVNVETFIRSSKTARWCLKGWRSGAVDFGRKVNTPEIPPYIFGAWLGDGSTRDSVITKPLCGMINEWGKYAQSIGTVIYNQEKKPNKCPMWRLRDGGVFRKTTRKYLNDSKIKFIPDDYKYGSKETRLNLLAGMIDSDGCVTHSCCCDWVSKNKQLAIDFAFVCRSLGFSCYISRQKKRIKSIGHSGYYWRASLSGDLSLIPTKDKIFTPRKQKKRTQVHGITVKDIGIGNYYGFEIDGDRLFLLGDFTVTHNTVCAGAIISAAKDNGKRVVFVVHRQELAHQTAKTLRGFGVEPAFIMAGKPEDPTNPVQIASIGTLKNRLNRHIEPDLIIFDECSHCLANQWLAVRETWNKAKILGLTATPCRLDGKPLRKFFDTLVIGPTVADLIGLGALTPYDYYAPSIVDTSHMQSNRSDYTKDALSAFSMKREIIGDNIEQYRKLAMGKRNIVFACNVKHSLEIVNRYNAAGIPAAHLDGETPQDEREKTLEKFARGEILVLSNVELFGEGFDLPAIEVVSLLRPTLSTSLYLQQVGRALRPCKELGKERAIILDHVGNYERHGMPDDDRQWSLKGGLLKRNTSAKSTEPTVRVQRCPECFFAHKPAKSCPLCGHVYINENGVKEVAGELVLLGTKEHQDALKNEIKKVATYEELVKIEKERNYKTWWAENMWLKKTGIDLRQTVTGLNLIAKTRGYSRGWSWLQAKRRGIL